MVDLRKLDLSKANQDHEKSRIRLLKLDDPEEKKRLWEIETNSLVVKFVGNISETDEDLVTFAIPQKHYLVLAIEGKSGYVDEDEVGKLQGWITVYPEDKRRLARLQKNGLVDLMEKGLRVLEIGFAKHPKARSGQMGSAVRQVMRLLHQEHATDGEHRLVVTAYTNQTNLASMRVLAAAGFEQVGKMPYLVKDKHHDCVYLLDFVDK